MIPGKAILLGLFLVHNLNALYTSNSPVVQLTQNNFANLVTKTDGLWLVEFYAPWCGHCKTLAPEFEKAAKALKGMFQLGAVDMTTEQSVGSPYDIKGFPTIKLFGANKNAPIDYQGARTAQAIVDFMLSQAKSLSQGRLGGNSGSKPSGSGAKDSGHHSNPGDKAVDLTADNFKPLVLNQSKEVWMVIFYAPWCGHCKSTMPAWESAAKDADAGVRFGKLDCTVHQNICTDYGVQGYPTIKLFVNGKAEDYSGARDKSSFLSFANAKMDALVPPRELAEMDSHAVFEDYCIEAKGVCVIAFLPNLVDSGSEKRAEYIAQLQALKDKHQDRPLTFMWVQGGDNFDFEDAMGLGFGFPSVIAINHGKKKYSTMRASYSKDNLEKFIGDLLLGKVAVQNLRDNLPKIKAKKAPASRTVEDL